jgi:hypothetical protein
VTPEPESKPAVETAADDPPAGYKDAAGEALDTEACLSGEPLAQPEPEYEYDQRVSG